MAFHKAEGCSPFGVNSPSPVAVDVLPGVRGVRGAGVHRQVVRRLRQGVPRRRPRRDRELRFRARAPAGEGGQREEAPVRGRPGPARPAAEARVAARAEGGERGGGAAEGMRMGLQEGLAGQDQVLERRQGACRHDARRRAGRLRLHLRKPARLAGRHPAHETGVGASGIPLRPHGFCILPRTSCQITAESRQKSSSTSGLSLKIQNVSSSSWRHGSLSVLRSAYPAAQQSWTQSRQPART